MRVGTDIQEMERSSALLGQYNHSIDAKGRVIVPTRLREALGEGFVVTVGLDGCLYMYDAMEWEAIVQKINAIPTDSSEAARKKRILKRTFFAGADIPVLDKMGRILVPAALREHAALKKDVVFVGVTDHVEIWDAERWNEQKEADFDDLAAGFEGNGLMM